MKFLVLSNDYTGTVVCKRLKQEGHEYLYINPFHRNNGINTTTNIYVAIQQKPDAAIICNTGFTVQHQLLKSKNIPVFGGTLFQEQVELEEQIMYKICKEYHIRLLKDTTKIAYPLSTEIWFSCGDPLYQYINYIKQNKFLAGDLGQDVDGESVVLWSNPTREVEAVKRIFENGLFDILKVIKYTGVFALDAYISEDDHYPYIVKIIPRLQAPVLVAMLELFDGNFGQLINQILENRLPSIILSEKIAISVAVSQPPYPFENSGLIKYVVGSNLDWMLARKQIASQLKEMTSSIKNIQFRIDGGIQGQHLNELRTIGYYNN